jgi:hypothetical protein
MALTNPKIISHDDYKKIADQYAGIMNDYGTTQSQLYAAVEYIVLLQVVNPEVDLLTPFWNAYLSVSNTAMAFARNSMMIDAVRALNNHILNYDNAASINTAYDTIDKYLADSTGQGSSMANALQQTWADLSQEASGTRGTISANYIVA